MQAIIRATVCEARQLRFLRREIEEYLSSQQPLANANGLTFTHHQPEVRTLLPNNRQRKSVNPR